MPTYKYTGPEPRTPAPPLQGDLVPGETVESAEPVDHPDLELVDGEPTALEVEDTPRRRGGRAATPKE